MDEDKNNYAEFFEKIKNFEKRIAALEQAEQPDIEKIGDKLISYLRAKGISLNILQGK